MQTAEGTGAFEKCGWATLCRPYRAVPRSAAPALDRVLADTGLLGAAHVVRLHIPDCLVMDTINERT